MSFEVTEELSSKKDSRTKWVGVYIGALAVLLAICNVGEIGRAHV